MIAPSYADDLVTVLHGDSTLVLTELGDASIDAVVTDPPYGLGFMGKAWDTDFTPGDSPMRRDPQMDAVNTGAARQGGRQRQGQDYQRRMARDSRDFQRWCEAWASECLRVLKPGGHLLAFGGSRTWHRLCCAIEDAGFEIRDSIAWIYGSGFPKSLDVSKAIDKAAGAELERQAPRRLARPSDSLNPSGFNADGWAPQVNDPVTPDAEKWSGWGTALKPAFEPIVVGRKPLSGAVAANVLAHGTGALNIDGCRVPATDADREAQRKSREAWAKSRLDGRIGNPGQGAALAAAIAGDSRTGLEPVEVPAGRWPTNVVLDESQAAELDAQSGVSVSRTGQPRGASSGEGWGMTATGAQYEDAGGASRFFPTFRYEPKAPTSERPRLEGVEPNPSGIGRRRCAICGKQAVNVTSASQCQCDEPEWVPAESSSAVAHPTVKPLDLMRWLVRLVTPPGGLVLDPFAGSGTTGEACVIEGLHCLLIERETDYLSLIVQRLTKPIQPDLFGSAS